MSGLVSHQSMRAPPIPEDQRQASQRPLPKKTQPKVELTAYHPLVHEQLEKDVPRLLLGFRCLNALLIATFFQPDEYFQSLEPAWQLAFGAQSGAWITWEWHNQLRSSLHPVMFAAFYFTADRIMTIGQLFPQFRASVLVWLPRVVMALFAAAGDLYTWKLAEKLYGRGSNTAWVTLLMVMGSPWQWFAATRTFSNSLETVLTIVALYHWPWALGGDVVSTGKDSTLEPRIFSTRKELNQLRLSLIFAGIACILRPTNLMIWGALIFITMTRLGLIGITRATFDDWMIVVRESILCGSCVLALSAISDYFYFGFWTFPPYQWLNFNITQSLAVFYGTNDWHYYLSQGLPLLLTSYVPFGLLGLWSGTSASNTSPPIVANIRFILSFIIITTISTLSLISHKEVRFIYPLLPPLHILAAPHLASFLASIPTHKSLQPTTFQPNLLLAPSKKKYLYLLATFNITLALYATQVHQRGVIDVTHFLRHEYEAIHLSNRGLVIPTTAPGSDDDFPPTHDWNGRPDEVFAGFLMPCHSTPWRSHLIHPTLKAWALSCEPPLHLSAGSAARAAYRDEADRFYDDMMGFLRREVGGVEKPWPRFVVGFEGIEGILVEFYAEKMPGWSVRRRWEGFNGHFHDDARRRGKVVVWEFLDSSAKGL